MTRKVVITLCSVLAAIGAWLFLFHLGEAEHAYNPRFAALGAVVCLVLMVLGIVYLQIGNQRD
jgi:hypothetical protein